MKLKARTALITGGGRGIGRAIAVEFAKEGASVFVAARTVEEIARVASEVKSEYKVDAGFAACDVSDLGSVRRAFALAKGAFEKSVDILVNSAGVAESATLLETGDELWQRHIEVNLTGAFFCMREALQPMVEHGWGRIINIASVAGKAGAPYISAYAASKHGLIGLSRSVALEVARRGVTVNAICPGYVDTDMAAHAIENITVRTGRSPGEARAVLEQMNPQKRLITSEEVAALALLLASEEGRGINGQALNVDGGSLQF